jgi:hypothetical protein
MTLTELLYIVAVAQEKHRQSLFRQPADAEHRHQEARGGTRRPAVSAPRQRQNRREKTG